MVTLGLDLSSKSSGWSIFKDGNLYSYGCITASSQNLYKRIDKMIAELDKILATNKIDFVYIEDVIPSDVHENQAVFKALTYLQGFVLHLLNKYNLQHKFFLANEWRKACGIHTGRGIKRESLKPKDIKFVETQYDIHVNDDVADAICINFAGNGGTPIAPQVTKTADGFEFG